MSVLDIDLETNIIDFSNHDRSGRIYDPDCAKIPDEYTIPTEVMGIYDKLPEVGDPDKIYIVNGKLYMYTVYGDWCNLSPVLMESEEKRIKEKMDARDYFSEYHEKRIRNLKADIKLRLKELNGE